MDLFLPSQAVIVVRVLAPFALLRWPLGGAVFSLLLDYYDWALLGTLGWGLFGGGAYQITDKILDFWFLTMLLVVSQRWKDPLARTTAAVLYAWRFAGVFAFAVTGKEGALVLTPNVIEEFYLIWAVILKWFQPFALTPKRLAVILVLITVPKFFQEACMHWWYPEQGIGPCIRGKL